VTFQFGQVLNQLLDLLSPASIPVACLGLLTALVSVRSRERNLRMRLDSRERRELQALAFGATLVITGADLTEVLRATDRPAETATDPPKNPPSAPTDSPKPGTRGYGRGAPAGPGHGHHSDRPGRRTGSSRPRPTRRARQRSGTAAHRRPAGRTPRRRP